MSELGADGAAKDRLEALDLLRGLAALAILVRHFPWPNEEVLLFTRSYLGVDLFFTLSGFVIAYSYQGRLSAGLPGRRYLLARLVRLYPLYLAATLLAAAWMATGLIRNGPIEGLVRLGATLATAVLFLPTPDKWSLAPGSFFPLDYPAWSLFFELVVNALFGIVASRLTNRLLAALIAAGALGLALAVWRYGNLDLGSDWETAPWAFGRAMFSFFVGVAVYRWRERVRLPGVPVWLLGLVLLVAYLPTRGDLQWIYDLACIVVLFPLLVWAAADASSGPAMRAVSRHAGTLSYPIYVLQMPLIAILTVLLRKASGIELKDAGVGGMALHLAFVVGVSWLAARWFDEPARVWLKRRFGLPRAPTPAQTAP